jgi:hypothetical protein
MRREVGSVYLAYHTKTANTHTGTGRRFYSAEADGTALLKLIWGNGCLSFVRGGTQK